MWDSSIRHNVHCTIFIGIADGIIDSFNIVTARLKAGYELLDVLAPKYNRCAV